MEDFPIDIDWDKIYRNGFRKILEAQRVFIPVSESISSKPLWEVAMDRQDSSQETNASNKDKPDLKKAKTFIPGKVFFPKEIDSCLTKKEQAICVKVLSLYQAGLDLNRLTNMQQHDVQTYRNLQGKIQEENVKFLDYVKADWRKRYHRAEQIKVTLRAYAHGMWERKLQRSLSYAQFYKAFNVLPLSRHDHDPIVNVTHCRDILHLGTVAKFSCPTLSSKCLFKVCTLPPPENEHIYNSKLPVSQDAHVKTLLDNHPVDVVISMSTLKRLMDDSNFEVGWDIPVVVKAVNVKQENGAFKTKNVIYIDKPLPKRMPSNDDFNEQCHKYLTRTNLCQIPEIVHPGSETTRMNPNFHKSTPQVKESSSTPEVEDGEITEKGFIGCSDNEDASEGAAYSNKNVVHHNVTYSIWNVKLNNEQNVLMKNRVISKEIKLLVRCKIDACEQLDNGNMRPLVVVPKLEYQLEHGAGIATKSELIRQWTDLFFRPYSHLYRVRMQGGTSEVVSVESVSMQKINTEAVTHHQFKPHLRLSVLYTIFSVLGDWKPGNYLLRHRSKIGPFVELFQEVNPDAEWDNSRIYDLYSDYSTENCHTVPARKPWCPIDVNYILPVHTTFKRMPGMFKPLLVPFVSKKKYKAAKKKRKGKKNAKKRKAAK